MSKQLEAEAKSVLLGDIINHMCPQALYELKDRWNQPTVCGILDSIKAKLKTERTEQKARATEAAEAEAEVLRGWLEDVTGLRVTVRRATPRVIGLYARGAAPGGVVVHLRVVRSKPGAPLWRWYETHVDVPLPERWRSRRSGRGHHPTAAEAVAQAVGSALADADTRAEFRPLLNGIAERLRVQREGAK